MTHVEKWQERLSIIFLLSAGLLGTVVSVADLVGVDMTSGIFAWVKDSATITLLVVSVLTTAIGIERISRFGQVDRRLEHLETLIASSVGGILIRGYDELYGYMVKQILHDVQEKITVTTLSPAQHNSSQFREQLSQRLKEKKHFGTPIRFDLIIGNPSTDPERVDKVLKYTQDVLTKYDVLNFARVYVTDIDWGIDFLLADDKHAVIVFPAMRGSKELRQGIVFLNQPRVAEAISLWINEYLLHHSRLVGLQVNLRDKEEQSP